MTPIYFCLTKGFKGPSPVIFYGLDQNKDSHGHDKCLLIQTHELPIEHRDLTINQLEMIYPYKGEV